VLIGAVVLWAPFAVAREAQTGEGSEPTQAAAQQTLDGDGREDASQPVATAKSEQTWYGSSVSRNEGGGYVIIHFWSKATRFRAETVIGGHRITTIVNGETYYILDPVLATGVAIERSQESVAQDAERGRPFGNELELILRDGGEKVRTERVSGQACEVYRITDDNGRRQAWITIERPRVPVRVENFDRSSGRTTYVEYTNWLVAPLISDTFFEPDERIEMERFGYREYRARVRDGQPPGPAPVLYSELLHGRLE
jgi:outer membrane lipoprotein-sorting protein